MRATRSGVRAVCSDCHVPHEWTNKIARKMQASKEVWGHIFGTIDTRRKFLDHRLELAKREWARLKSNDSLECRNCHSAESMDITRQGVRAVAVQSRASRYVSAYGEPSISASACGSSRPQSGIETVAPGSGRTLNGDTIVWPCRFWR